MQAYELIDPNTGSGSGYWCCTQCRLVSAAVSPHRSEDSQEYAERCCMPKVCEFCKQPTEPSQHIGIVASDRKALSYRLYYPSWHDGCLREWKSKQPPPKPDHPSLSNAFAHALYAEMAEISEERYCAGWYTEIEYLLWDEVQSGASANLKTLSESAGGWICWFDEDDTYSAGPRLVPFSFMQEPRP